MIMAATIIAEIVTVENTRVGGRLVIGGGTGHNSRQSHGRP